MEITVSAITSVQDITLPMETEQGESLINEILSPGIGSIGLTFDGYKLQKCLCVNPHSEIWIASDQLGLTVVVKLSQNILADELYEQINRLQCEYLVPVLGHGYVMDYGYEVMPYYRNGWLNGKVDEITLKETVLPSLTNALKCLHENHLIHNDIKPENLFWSDDKKSVLLGDFGCVSMSGSMPCGYSLAYVAPELLLGNPAKPSSDWVSVGLTLGTLLSGKKIINGESKTAVLKWWEKSYVFCDGSNSVNQLINGMIQRDVKRRQGPKAAQLWMNNSQIGAENRVRHRRENSVKKQVLIFENPRFVVENIESMLLAIEHYWEHFVFLLESGKVELFLRSIKEEYYQYCLLLKANNSAEQIAFYLSYHFSHGEYFIWRGVKYSELCELEETWEKDPDSVKDFLAKGLVSFVLEQDGAGEEGLSYVKELMNISRLDSEKACNLLFIALRGEESFLWDGNTYTVLEKLIEDICNKPEYINEIVDDLLHSSRFQAWMTFQGYGNFVETILKRCSL